MRNKYTHEYIEAEADAEEILKSFNITKPPVDTILVNKLFRGIHIDISDDFFEDEVTGFSYSHKGKWYILLNGKVPLGAQRFTLFHELFHMLRSEPGFSRDDAKSRLRESRADAFAASILMPARWFRREWEKCNDINQMAEFFFVSPSAVKIRLMNLENYLKA